MGQEGRAAEESAAALQNGGCFVAGTPVQMADGSSRPIEQLQKGDVVMSRNPFNGKTEPRPVARTFKHQHHGTLLVELATGEKIETTPEHLFDVDGKGFVPAGELKLSDHLVGLSGHLLAVKSVQWKTAAATVYNLEVEDDHTYFVGTSDGGVWVHNACPGPHGDGPPIPGEYLAGNAPQQVTPGIRTLEGQHVNDLGNVQPWRAHYDEFGRMEARTDYNAGNRAAGIPDIHHHTFGYSGGRRSGTWHETGSHIPGEYQP